MRTRMQSVSFPIVLICIGVIWLVHELDWLPNLQVLGAFVLMAAGCAVLAAEGVNKSSVITGPLLICAGIAWYARSHEWFDARLTWPIGLIVVGALLFISRLPSIPERPSAKLPGNTGNQTN